ncbi:hypothetical protein CWATWH8502_2099 [Crocosphaera watsonii WH 8502]|uniref:DUF433 domain-containing protein n=1 Tax=Crocosphaera watsonii WH 8502 TaxID=423474 RepID=T2IEQ0_CROWT|nr:DUF433 domain-containing protein [Crocosphaera watsonii]CCQ51334.1 hypothetical protein CWATWH8502_2099 [Crocosphaera watsonii WH 8502]
MLQLTEHCHIVRNSEILSGEPIIKGTRTPVRAIVEMWRIGVSPEEIPQRLSHLILSQVFDALSYYLDHQVEMNKYIELNQVADELIPPQFTQTLVKAEIQGTPGQQLLRFAGSITSDDLDLMNEAIKEGCQQLDVDEW